MIGVIVVIDNLWYDVKVIVVNLKVKGFCMFVFLGDKEDVVVNVVLLVGIVKEEVKGGLKF